MNSNQQKGRQYRIAMKHITNKDGWRDHVKCEMEVNREIAIEQAHGLLWLLNHSPGGKTQKHHKNMVLKSRQLKRKHRRSNNGQN